MTDSRDNFACVRTQLYIIYFYTQTHARTHARMRTHTHTHTLTHTHTQTHTHTHTHIIIITHIQCEIDKCVLAYKPMLGWKFPC